MLGTAATVASIGIPALFNLGRSMFGAQQLNKAKRPTAPKYEVPTAVGDYMRQMNLLAKKDLPGRDILEDQIGGQVAGAIGDVNKAATSSGAALGAITGMNERAQTAIRDLGVTAAEFRAGREMQAAESNKYLADYQEKAWEYNQNIPYQQKMNEYVAAKQAGNANLWGGLEGIGTSVVQGLGSLQRDRQWQSMIDAINGTGGATANAAMGGQVGGVPQSGNSGYTSSGVNPRTGASYKHAVSGDLLKDPKYQEWSLWSNLQHPFKLRP